jgi:predicted ABC-type ATPase
VWISDLLKKGWKFDLVFLWLPSADLAVARVEDRVRLGGHGVPEEVIRRRYKSGLLNFFKLYRPLATSWRMYDNSGSEPRLIASGSEKTVRALDPQIWNRIVAEFEDA